MKEAKMASKIEKMNRMRRNILFIVIIGSSIAFGAFLYPSIYRFFHLNERPRFDGTLFLYALAVWLCAILFFGVRYFLYKNALRKDPSLREAVNDERVKGNWLKAYRFAFFAVVLFQGLMLLLQFLEALVGPMYLLLPQLYLTLFLASLSLVGAFLYYNREAKDG
jgi:membrane protease YdiL (CAAX protease family)